MKNSRKRKFISRDINFLKNHKPVKKLKVNGLDDENRSPINWHEVKIILDATVVEKYLKNKKPTSEVLITTSINNELSSYREKNLDSCIPQAKEKINNIFSQRNDVMVKLEIPDDIRFDYLTSNENFDFADVSIKQEDHISAQDTVTFDNDPINDDKFAESMNDDFQCQNNNNNYDNHVALTTQVIETEFKNEVSGSNVSCEQIIIDPEFKHEEVISQHYETTESVKKKNNNIAIEETSVPTIRRSSRKRKICHNYDNCDYEIVKKPRCPSNVNKKPTPKVSDRNSNCSSKSTVINSDRYSNCRSKSRIPSKTNLRKNLASPQPENDGTQLFQCDHCDYQISHKKKMVRHLHERHLSLFSNNLLSPYCDKKFKTKQRMKKHECTMEFYFNCKFCSVSVKSEPEMKEHLMKKHLDKCQGRSTQKFVDTVWYDSVRDVIKDLEREGNMNKLTHFGIKFIKNKTNYERRTDFVKFYCKNCNKSYEKSFEQKTKCCPQCNFDEERSMNTLNRNTNKVIEATKKENNQLIYNCEMCDYEGATKSQLYEHIVSMHTRKMDNSRKEPNFMCSKCGNTFFFGKRRSKLHEQLCGIQIRYPCKFCPMTCLATYHLRSHLYSIHIDKLNGFNLEDIVKEIATFKKTIRKFNLAMFQEKYSKAQVVDETIGNSNIYLEDIKSILKPVCSKCNSTVTQLYENCLECQTILTYQCLRCDESFEKYSTAWEHVTQTCKNTIFKFIKESNEDSVRNKVSTTMNVRSLLKCDYCSFQNSSKLFLSRHIMQKHKQATRVTRARYTCINCKGKFYSKAQFNDHKLQCPINYIYNCNLCEYMTTNTVNMREHMIEWHSYYFHRDDKGFYRSLHDAILKIVENRTMNQKAIQRFNETGKAVRRTFLENIESVRYHCAKCDETLEKKITHVKHAKYCSKCQSRLRLECKVCDKGYSTWRSMTAHFGKNLCPGVKPPNGPISYELDHAYASNDHSDHSYACKFGPLDTENDGNS